MSISESGHADHLERRRAAHDSNAGQVIGMEMG